MLSFFVEGSLELSGLTRELEKYRISVKRSGFAKPSDISIFFDENQNGFYLAAYKLKEEEIPDCVCLSPFLVRAGENWTKEGLENLIEKYSLFFVRGIPSLDFEIMSDRRIINICERCIDFPWGGVPSSKEGRRKIVKWLEKVEKIMTFKP